MFDIYIFRVHACLHPARHSHQLNTTARPSTQARAITHTSSLVWLWVWFALAPAPFQKISSWYLPRNWHQWWRSTIWTLAACTHHWTPSVTAHCKSLSRSWTMPTEKVCIRIAEYSPSYLTFNSNKIKILFIRRCRSRLCSPRASQQSWIHQIADLRN